jgi:hypothetical protein
MNDPHQEKCPKCDGTGAVGGVRSAAATALRSSDVPAERLDVIQIDPRHSMLGPMLAIVQEVREWGVMAFWFCADSKGQLAAVYERVPHGGYVRIGKAAWSDSQFDGTAYEAEDNREKP